MYVEGFARRATQYKRMYLTLHWNETYLVSMADEIYRRRSQGQRMCVLWQKKTEDRSRKSEKSYTLFWRILFCDDE